MKILSFLGLLWLSTNLFSQSIWTNPITGTNPNTSNPYTTGQTVDPNITVSGIGRGTGVNGVNSIDRYNSDNWSTANSIDLSDYFEWTLTPDPGCEISFTSFIYTGLASTDGPTRFRFRSSLDNYSSDIGSPTETGTTVNLSVATYQNISSTITFRFYAYRADGSNGTFSINDFTFNGSTSCSSAPTLSTGAVTGGPFSIDCSNSDTGSVAYTGTGTFNVGNTFTVEMSNASGSFASPTVVGSASASGLDPSGSIAITIPAGTPTGTGYRFRIVTSNPVLTASDNGTNISITLSGGPCTFTPPYMTSVMINSCASPGCSEGDNEIIFGNTGDYSVLGTAANIQVSYEGNSYTQTFTNVSSTTTALNTAANCSQPLIVDGLNQTMPPGSSFVIVKNTICPGALNWSQLCGAGPIYIFYSTDGSWSSSGNFTNDNSGAADRTIVTSITNTDGQTFTINYIFNTGNNSPSGGADGDYATWLPTGGMTNTHTNTGAACTLLPVFLDTDVTYFDVKLLHGQVQCTWSTASEENNDYFSIMHSANGIDFSQIANIAGAGNSSYEIEYNIYHERPSRGINYYKLTSTDYDGTTYNKGIASVMVEGEGTYFDPYTSQLKFSEKSEYVVYSTDGKLLGAVNNEDSMDFQHHGMILIQDLRTLSIERLFIP